ncbi:MAG: UDP-glucose 4-epimerase GalE [Phycisphaera sp.]|nr:UDP-glucose 4-epimerase GalE [Phycisphaera sp.]
MRLLLTGGAGYVGSACLRWLLRHGHDPFAYDNLSEGNTASVPGDRLIVGDVGDRDALARAMHEVGAQAVMHFAALASVPQSISDPDTYWRVNVGGTKNVLDAMRDVGVDRVLFSSTAATYGFDAAMPLTEDSPQQPQTPYGTTKLACEWMIKEYSRAYGIGYAILRYFNAAGADPDGRFGECRRHEGHLIPLVLYAAQGKRDKILIYGGDWPTPDGTCVRDYIHTDDLAQAHQLAVEASKPGGGAVYNLSNGAGVSVMQVVQTCEQVVGRPIPHEVVDRRPGDPPTLIASSARIQSELGWSPRYPDIRDIVETAWRWHHTHPHGYADQHAETKQHD